MGGVVAVVVEVVADVVVDPLSVVMVVEEEEEDGSFSGGGGGGGGGVSVDPSAASCFEFFDEMDGEDVDSTLFSGLVVVVVEVVEG